MLSIDHLMIFAAATAIGGAISGFLAGLFGIGGGAVMVPVLYQVLTMLQVDETVRMHLAVGTSLAVIIPTSLRSYQAHRKRGAVDMDLLRSFLLPVPIGVVLASLTAAYISSEGLRLIFTMIMIAVALRLLFNRESWRIGKDIPTGPLRSLVGVVIGYLSTLMGIGGGVMNNTFMTLYGRSMHQAVATSSGVGVLIAIPGTIGYIWAGWGNSFLPAGSTGFVNWIALAFITPLAIFVTPYGVQMAHALKKRQLEVAFGVFAMAVSLRFLISLL